MKPASDTLASPKTPSLKPVLKPPAPVVAGIPQQRRGLRSLAAKLAKLIGDKHTEAIGTHNADAIVALSSPEEEKSQPEESFSLPTTVTSKFDADELSCLRKIYKELNTRSPAEGLDKATFLEYFPLPVLWGERLFIFFDYKKLGRIDYEALMRGLAACCRGTKTERIRILFSMFDLDGDERISREELALFLSNVPSVEQYLSRGNVGLLSRANSKSVLESQLPGTTVDSHLPVPDSQQTAGNATDSSQAAAQSEPAGAGLEELYWKGRGRRRGSDSEDSSSSYASSLSSQMRAWMRGAPPEPSSSKRPMECNTLPPSALPNVPRFCSTTSWRTSLSEAPSSRNSPRARQSEHVHDYPPPEEEEERYVLGAGPSPMIAELLAEAQQEAAAVDLEGIINFIMETYNASDDSGLSLDEFRSFMEHYSGLLRLFAECLQEEVWGLHGHALYRPQRQGGPSSLLPSARPTRPASVISGRAPDVSDLTQAGRTGSSSQCIPAPDRSKVETGDMIQLERWIKLQQLFNQAAPRQQSYASTQRPGLNPPPQSEEKEDNPLVNPDPVYTRHSRYAGSREVLDFLEVSLGHLVCDEEEPEAVPPTVPSDASLKVPSAPAEAESASLWQERKDALSCPQCLSPLLVCPKCARRFPVLRFDPESQRLCVECVQCADEQAKQFTACWICQWPFAKAIDLIDRHDAIMEGTLWKIGKHTQRWVCRHFVLVDKLLYYYAKPDDNIPKGFVFLEGCFVDPVATPANLAEGKEGGPGSAGLFGFCIIHAGGSFGRRDLYAADEKTRDRWVTALRSTLNQQPIEHLFVLHEIIGQGKFSVVYRATEKTTQQEYAVKVINKSRMNSHEKELLRSEMAILRLLRHPHVIYLKSLVASKEVMHIVMELVPGGELFDAISTRTRLNEMTVNRLTGQLIRTLVYLHKSGIVHRDLKPENILLTSRNVDEADIKIADFGLSCICGPLEKLYQPCGTLVYVAPEVLTLQGYNHQVDLWSLGVIVYLLLCGKLPFPMIRASGLSVLTEREKFYTPKFEGSAWKNVSRSAQDFICKLLQIDPRKRLTATEASTHIWIKNPTAVLKDVTMQSASSDLTPRAADVSGTTGAGGGGGSKKTLGATSTTSNSNETGGGLTVKEAGDSENVSVAAGDSTCNNTKRLLIRTGTDEDEVAAAAPLLLRTETVGRSQPQLPPRPPPPPSLQTTIIENTSPRGGTARAAPPPLPIGGSKTTTPISRRSDTPLGAIVEPSSEPVVELAPVAGGMVAAPQVITITAAAGAAIKRPPKAPAPPVTPTGGCEVLGSTNRTVSQTRPAQQAATRPKLVTSRSEEIAMAPAMGDADKPRRSVDSSATQPKYTSPTRLAQCSGASKP